MHPHTHTPSHTHTLTCPDTHILIPTPSPHTPTPSHSPHTPLHRQRSEVEGRQKRLLEEETELNSRQEVQNAQEQSVWNFVTKYRLVALCTVYLASNPGFPFQISIFLQSCKTKSGMEILDSRLGVHHHSNLVSIEMDG